MREKHRGQSQRDDHAERNEEVTREKKILSSHRREVVSVVAVECVIELARGQPQSSERIRARERNRFAGPVAIRFRARWGIPSRARNRIATGPAKRLRSRARIRSLLCG